MVEFKPFEYLGPEEKALVYLDAAVLVFTQIAQEGRGTGDGDQQKEISQVLNYIRENCPGLYTRICATAVTTFLSE